MVYTPFFLYLYAQKSRNLEQQVFALKTCTNLEKGQSTITKGGEDELCDLGKDMETTSPGLLISSSEEPLVLQQRQHCFYSSWRGTGFVTSSGFVTPFKGICVDRRSS